MTVPEDLTEWRTSWQGEDLTPRVLALIDEVERLREREGESQHDARYILSWFDAATLSEFRRDAKGSAIYDHATSEDA